MTTPIEAYGAPASEFSEDFADGMRKRMAVSFHKYGLVKDGAAVIDCIDCLKQRLNNYLLDGNTEWLMDVANFAMMEFMFPSHPKAHFRATDSDESPGRKSASTGHASAKANKDIR